jgi:hypothetical protein
VSGNLDISSHTGLSVVQPLCCKRKEFDKCLFWFIIKRILVITMGGDNGDY